ncbi:MAG: DUF4926 domain-containing protein [Bacteroidota bacterium]
MKSEKLPVETLIALKENLHSFDLKKGDVGRITQVNTEEDSYMVTFKNFQGQSKAWIKLHRGQFRPV